MDFKKINAEANLFLETVFKELNSKNIDIHNWSIDHLCFRTKSNGEYEKLKLSFKSFSKLLVESPVNGRMISTFKLHTPIVFKNRIINLIELPAPKLDNEYESGFEHIEIVTPMRFAKIIDKYKNLNFSQDSVNKNLNKELKLKFNKFQIKFHHCSLETIVNLESSLGSFLNQFDESEFFPICDSSLGIKSDSEINVIIQTKNRNLFKNEFKFFLNNKIIKFILYEDDFLSTESFLEFMIKEKIVKIANLNGNKLNNIKKNFEESVYDEFKVKIDYKLLKNLSEIEIEKWMYHHL